MKKYFVMLALVLAGCVHVDPDTGETLPRGEQKYKFATVEKRAELLRDGMAKIEALLLLGSPAKKNQTDTVWTYLPERPAVLSPARALELEFENNVLVKHRYAPIVFGHVF